MRKGSRRSEGLKPCRYGTLKETDGDRHSMICLEDERQRWRLSRLGCLPDRRGDLSHNWKSPGGSFLLSLDTRGLTTPLARDLRP